MTFVQIETRNGMIGLDGYSRNKTLKGALKDLAREVAKINESEGKFISDNIDETVEMVAAGMPNVVGQYCIEAQEVHCACRCKYLDGDENNWDEDNVVDEYAEGHWYLYIRFCAPEQESKESETSADDQAAEADAESTEQVNIETAATETTEVEADAAEGETVYTAESIPERPACTALAIPFSLDAAIAEFRERKALENIDMTVPGIEETALDTVKAIIAGMDGKHSSKVRLQATKKGIQVRYRNCVVCALVFDAKHTLTGIRFMGTTMETVNEATVCEPAGLSTYADKIVERVVFIDWWWANASKKVAA